MILAEYKGLNNSHLKLSFHLQIFRLDIVTFNCTSRGWKTSAKCNSHNRICNFWNVVKVEATLVPRLSRCHSAQCPPQNCPPGHYSLVNIVPLGHYSPVNNVPPQWILSPPRTKLRTVICGDSGTSWNKQVIWSRLTSHTGLRDYGAIDIYKYSTYGRY